MARKICQSKFKEHSEIVDLRARKKFHGATRGAVKCVTGFNHYGKRHKEFNYNLPQSNCPRCGNIETWSHVIQCSALHDTNKKFVSNVIKEITPKVCTDAQKQVVQGVKQDLQEFLIGEMNNYVTNQSMIGWKQAFRGCVVKHWRNDCKDRVFNHEINKIIIKMCTKHYVECWKDRNEEFHDPQRQRQHVIEWMKEIE